MHGEPEGSSELVRALGQLSVAVGDAPRRVGRPAHRDTLVADRDVRVVVGAIGDRSEAVDEADPLEVGVEPELALERAVHLAPSLDLAHDLEYSTSPAAQTTGLFERSRKGGATTEYACDYAFRPLAHLVVVGLLPLRVPPPAVVLAAGAAGIVAAVELARGHLVAAALLVLLKTVLDNADGQLARASGKTSALGRYLDSESDLLVDAALFAALGYVTGRPFLAAAAFVVLTLVLSVNFNLRRLYALERGASEEPAPDSGRLDAAARSVYAIVYGPQDRLVEAFVSWRLRRLQAGPDARLAYHDRTTLQLLHNMGLSGQMAALAACLALGHPGAYLWIVFAGGFALLALELRRELRAARWGTGLPAPTLHRPSRGWPTDHTHQGGSTNEERSGKRSRRARDRAPGCPRPTGRLTR